jgi:uncharacterized protein YjgD (DUF1641 family)
MTQLGDLRIEGKRLAESATDALSDDIIARLAELAGDSLVLLEQINQSQVDKALPAINRLVENGDLDRLVNLTRVLGSAADALSDDIVARLSETLSELMCIADRLARNENLQQMLRLLENQPLMDTVIKLADAAAEVSTEAAEESAGGIVGVYKTMTNAEVQTALAVVGRITEAYRR